ncbi:glycosyltransferase [Marinobacter sediminum]|uniref:glycosyltransferase n=1 Tax=Marinobacter sediminum TaxID=256323 RepID=UPI002030A40E|nr:glycosyltransferase [Marinobacter sediminum]MCM0612643.1 glycosyltransferase [Marinobacter sediminum]
MNLLLDVGSIKTGGGLQLAINFLKYLESKEVKKNLESVYVLRPEKGPLSDDKYYEFVCDGVLTYPDSYIKRKMFEVFTLDKFLRTNNIDIAYTFFGSGLGDLKNVRKVVSVAYPIICYPDSSYWDYLPFFKKFKKKLVNDFRRNRIKKADTVIVETEVMRYRLHKFLDLAFSRLTTIPPSPSSFVSDVGYENKGEENRILLLGGTDPHKNLWRLPSISNSLEKIGVVDYCFILSVSEEAFDDCLELMGVDLKFNRDKFRFVGSIHPEKINEIYASADFLMNVSDLESFSNNYMEAWKAGIPLICSDRDFSRNICKGSAVYIEPHDAEGAAEGIKLLIDDKSSQQNLVEEGKVQLSRLPTINEKFEMIFGLLK